MKVVIDGVRYVPVVEANANMEAIARGLIYQFWGEAGKEKSWLKKLKA